MIKIGNGREVWLYLALMAICFSTISLMSILFLDMIIPSQSALGRQRMDSFWDCMIVLLIKPNEKQVVMFRSFFSIGTPSLIHLGVA